MAQTSDTVQEIRTKLRVVLRLSWLLVAEVDAYRALAASTAYAHQIALADQEETIEHRKERARLFLAANQAATERAQFSLSEAAKLEGPVIADLAAMIDKLNNKAVKRTITETDRELKPGDLCPAHHIPLVDLGNGELGHEVEQDEDDDDDEEGMN